MYLPKYHNHLFRSKTAWQLFISATFLFIWLFPWTEAGNCLLCDDKNLYSCYPHKVQNLILYFQYYQVYNLLFKAFMWVRSRLRLHRLLRPFKFRKRNLRPNDYYSYGIVLVSLNHKTWCLFSVLVELITLCHNIQWWYRFDLCLSCTSYFAVFLPP